MKAVAARKAMKLSEPTSGGFRGGIRDPNPSVRSFTAQILATGSFCGVEEYPAIQYPVITDVYCASSLAALPAVLQFWIIND